MRLRKHMAAGVAFMTTATLVLSGCGGFTEKTTQSEAPVVGPKGELNAGAVYETTDYGPITTSTFAMDTNWEVLEGLYQFHMVDYSVYPALVAGDPVKVSDTVYGVTLHDGTKFSDGTPVTAEDVVSSYARTTDDKSTYKQFFGFVESVTAKDDKTVTIELKYLLASLRERSTNVKIVPTSMNADSLKAKPTGSGPYMYENTTPIEVTAVPNPNYNGGAPATVERIRWHVLKDDSARLATALDGTTDMMEAVPASASDQIKATGWTIESVQSYGNPFLVLNATKAPFNNAKVRQAVHMAIDKQKLVNSAMEGQATVATSFLPNTSPSYKETTTQLDYNVDAAKAAISATGLNEINLTTTDHPWIQNLIPQIKAGLKALGLTVTVNPMASSDLYSNVAGVDSPTFDVILVPGDPSVFGTDPGIIMGWWNADNVWTNKRSQWKDVDPENFNKLQEIMNETVQLDDDAAKAKWGETQDFLAEQVVTCPLFHRKLIIAYNGDKVTNFKPIASIGLDLVGVGLK